MCNPLIIMAAGAAVSAAGQYQQGQDAKAGAGLQSDLINRQALEVQDAGTQEAGKIRKAAESGRGAAVAGMAASGVQIGEGSALDVERQILKLGEEDAMMTLLNADRQARGMRDQARLTKWGGQQAVAASNTAMAGTFLQAAGKAYNMWGGKAG